jgi:O-antigen/teichoic acid export membrane protein
VGSTGSSLANSPKPFFRDKDAGVVARLLHGTGAGIAAYILGIAGNLVLLPLYLRFWSVTVYGEWMALYAVVNYLGNLDFGITGAGINAATIAFASGDWLGFKRVQGTAWVASLAISGIGIVFIALPSLLFFPVERLLHLTALAPHEARLIFCCLAVSLLVNIPGRQLITVYITIGNFAKYQWLYNAFLLAACLVTAGALFAGAGPVLLAKITAGTAIGTILFAALILGWGTPCLIPGIREADWRTARKLAVPTGQFGISLLANVLTLQAPVVLLSRVLGGPAVAIYTTTRTVANVIRGTVTLLRAPLRPELAAAFAMRSGGRLGQLFRFAVGMDAIIGLSFFAALWSGGGWLIRFWSHGQMDASPIFLHLMLVCVLLEGFLLVLGSTGWATNRARALSLGQISTSVASIIIMIPLVHLYGVVAVPLATVPSLLLIMLPVAVRDACREAQQTIGFVVGRLLFPFAVTGVICAVFAQWLDQSRTIPDWVTASIAAVLASTISVVMVSAIFLTRDDLMLLRNRFFGRRSKEHLARQH